MNILRVFGFLLTLSATTLIQAQTFLGGKVISPAQVPDNSAMLASGDLDGDGIDDLVVMNMASGSQSVGILFGSPSGFVDGTFTPISCIGAAAAIGDVNNDSRPDVILSCRDVQQGVIVTILNQGNRLFGNAMTSPVASNPSSYPLLATLATGDFDGDGKLDVVTQDVQNGVAYSMHGVGNGTFLLKSSWIADQGGESTIAADLNHDNKLDIITSSFLSSRIGVYLGKGDGTFQAATYLPGTLNYSPIVAEVTGDSNPDIVTTAIVTSPNIAYYTRVYRGNGDGTFQEVNSFSYSSAIGSLISGKDLDGDGRPDLLYRDENGITFQRGSGGGNFSAPVHFSTPSWGGGGTAVGDFDGDGVTDIVGSITYSNPVVFFLKGFAGPKFDAALLLDAFDSPVSSGMADLNGDGIADIVTNTIRGTVTFLGHGNGTFATLNDPVVQPEQLLLADLDGDGKPDALNVSYPTFGGHSVFRHGNGDGTFASPIDAITSTSGAGAAALGDLNGDGKAELVGVVNSFLNVWPGNGDGTFGAPTSYSYSGGGSYYPGTGKTVITDVTGDGASDVLVQSGSGIALFINDGTGSLTSGATYPGSTFTVADFDRDGKPDLLTLTSNAGSTEVTILLGDGSGQFTQSSQFTPTRNYFYVAAADLNADGKTDVVLSGPDVLAIMYGNGDGTFQPEQLSLAGDGPHEAMFADWNGDGALDFAVMNSAGGSPQPTSVSVLLNRGGSTAKLSFSVNPAQYGEPVELVASVTATVLGSPFPGGTITFSFDGAAPQSASLNGSGYAMDLGFPRVGSHPASGSYLGDGNFFPKPMIPASLTVTRANTSVHIASSANPLALGSQLTVQVTVQPSFRGTPSGTVSLSDNGVSLGSVSLDSAGTASFALNPQATGTHHLQASYSGDSNFVGSSSAFDQSVLYPTTLSLTSDNASALVRTFVGLTAVVSPVTGNPTGSVSFTENGQLLGQANIANGYAPLSIRTLSVGTHDIVASYAGDANFMPATSAVLRQSITDFSVTAVNDQLTLNAGASGSYTLNIASLGGFAGTISLSCTGAPALSTCSVPSTVQVNGNGATATVTITTTGPNHSALFPTGETRFAALGAPWLPFAACLVGGVWVRTRRSRNVGAAMLIVLLAVITIACGGGGGATPTSQQPSRTPAGSTRLTVIATTSANTPTQSAFVSHIVNLTLTVN